MVGSKPAPAGIPVIAALALAALVGLLPVRMAGAETMLASDLTIYRQAFDLADRDRHTEALRLASQAKDRLPAKVIRWMELAAPNGGSFEEIAAFIRENGDWPNLSQLRRRAEQVMPYDMTDQQVLAWFKANPPVSNTGFMRHADTLLANGDTARATAMVRKQWVEEDFSVSDEQDFLARYRDILRQQDHVARLDRLLWEQQEAPVKRMMPLVDAGYDALAEARLALANNTGNVEAAINRVPTRLQDDPGLLYERLRWRRRKDMDDGALEILRKQPAELGKPALWWTERHILARRAMERGDWRLAYRLASTHRQTDGQSLAQAEFLAGWLALRFLNDPAAAFEHFEKLYESVSTPISRSRGAYWLGRAAEAKGDRAAAKQWFEKAAGWPTTFYGQLAVRHLGSGTQARLPAEARYSRDQQVAFEKRELVRIARMLDHIEGGNGKERSAIFARKVGNDAKQPHEYVLAAKLADEIGRPDLAINIAKQAIQDDIYLYEDGYPVLKAAASVRAAEPALVHALIRQESTFNTNIVSSAGARGLMQLMPGTAQIVAKKLGVGHSLPRLTSDPSYNVLLGSTYIADMIDRFNGSYVLAAAAYNAGPGRVSAWLDKFGDPRGGAVDVVDWIELIPIYETRNYVQRVMEALQVYRVRLGGRGAEIDLDRDLNR